MTFLTSKLVPTRPRLVAFILITVPSFMLVVLYANPFAAEHVATIEEDIIDGQGPIEKYLLVTDPPPNVERDHLYLRRVRQFDRVIPASSSSSSYNTVGDGSSSTFQSNDESPSVTSLRTTAVAHDGDDASSKRNEHTQVALSVKQPHPQQRKPTNKRKKSHMITQQQQHQQETNNTQHRKARCVVFSCASPGYYLTDESLTHNVVRDCDRLHFSAYTFNRDGEQVASTWCRVPLLKHFEHYFAGYDRILYVDPDIRYRDPWVMQSDCGTNSSVVVATKPLGEGMREMQMNWLLICHPGDRRVNSVFDKWDEGWRDVKMQDQTVFNEVWSCGGAQGAIKCVENSFDNAIVVFHCGGYLPRFLRTRCMRKHF